MPADHTLGSKQLLRQALDMLVRIALGLHCAIGPISTSRMPVCRSRLGLWSEE